MQVKLFYVLEAAILSDAQNMSMSIFRTQYALFGQISL